MLGGRVSELGHLSPHLSECSLRGVLLESLSSTAYSRRLARLRSYSPSLVDKGGSLAFLFLGVRSGRPARRGGPDLLRWEEEREINCVLEPSSMGERAGRGARLVARGEGSFEALIAVAFLRLGLICFVRSFPAGQRGRVRLNLGRPELSVSKVKLRETKGRLSYKRGGKR